MFINLDLEVFVTFKLNIMTYRHFAYIFCCWSRNMFFWYSVYRGDGYPMETFSKKNYIK